jgi:acetate kinase
MNILVINSGSSSIKYKLFAMPDAAVRCAGLVERIGEPNGRIKHTVFTADGAQDVVRDVAVADHGAGLEQVAALLMAADGGVIASPAEIGAIGHRVVHGGERFHAPTIITPEVKRVIGDLIPFAPLHNPANLAGVEVAEQVFPLATQVAIFDTAFHQTMPAHAYRYAIPDALYTEHGIRVYGFHGTSHSYVAGVAAEFLGKSPAATNLITAHLGNGASITAIHHGRSVDTSMGFSPLPGLIMGTRSGDLDPAVVFYLQARLGMTPPEVDTLLNKQSGLTGLCGDNDLRDIEQRVAQGDAQATLALEMYAYRIRKYIGAYTAALGRVDALVFTAGVGENSELVRARVCDGLDGLGIRVDGAANGAVARGTVSAIHAEDSRVDVLVVPTDEELEIARQVYTHFGA